MALGRSSTSPLPGKRPSLREGVKRGLVGFEIVTITGPLFAGRSRHIPGKFETKIMAAVSKFFISCFSELLSGAWKDLFTGPPPQAMENVFTGPCEF